MRPISGLSTLPSLVRRRWKGAVGSLVMMAGTVVAGMTPLLAAPAPAPARVASPSSISAPAPDTYEKRVRYWINVERERRSLPRLAFAGCTDSVAERWTTYLVSYDEFFHQSMEVILNQCNARYAGETLGRGAITPKRLVQLWIKSDAHRAVLFSTSPRRVGIGSALDRSGRWVTTANFMRF
jgi:uncharacterized protein YkwD